LDEQPQLGELAVALLHCLSEDERCVASVVSYYSLNSKL
jgi:hypothetical protein